METNRKRTWLAGNISASSESFCFQELVVWFMEKLKKEAKMRKSSFSIHPILSPLQHDRFERLHELPSMESYVEEPWPMQCYFPMEDPRSPDQAMEFLSRTWSPASSDFFKILSLNGLVPQLEYDKSEKSDERSKNQVKEIVQAESTLDNRVTVDQMLTWLSNGMSASPYHPKHKQLHNALHNLRSWKSWLGGEVLRNLSRGCRRKRKEEVRLHAAQINAALSITKVAAAVAGIVASCKMEPANSNALSMVHGEWQNDLSTMVASAAALVATVCAEAAESVGANRAQVATAMTSGLSTRDSADVVTLTATAATCLRGAATLELRSAASRCNLEGINVLSRGTRLPFRTPGGEVQLRMLSICLKRDKLTLRVGKKFLGGAFARCKEYRIIEAVEDNEENGLRSRDHGLRMIITLSTTEGTVQILFEDPEQYALWKSTISHILSDH